VDFLALMMKKSSKNLQLILHLRVMILVQMKHQSKPQRHQVIQKDKMTKTLKNVQSIWSKKKLKRKEDFLIACLVLMMMIKNKKPVMILLQPKQHKMRILMRLQLMTQRQLMTLMMTQLRHLMMTQLRHLMMTQLRHLMMTPQMILKVMRKRKILDFLVVYLTQLRKLLAMFLRQPQMQLTQQKKL